MPWFLAGRWFVSMDSHVDRRSGPSCGHTAPPRLIVSRPLSWVRQNDVRLHDGVQFLEVGRGGGVAVVDLLACIRVMGPEQRAVGAGDLTGRRVRRHVQSGVVVRLIAHGWFRFPAADLGMAPGVNRGPSIGRRRAGTAFMCAKKRCDVARSLRPTIPMRPPPLFPVGALPVGHPRGSLPAGQRIRR